jgi:hypothetical protein
MPHIMIDYKRDELIAQIPYVQEISLKDFPKGGGLYVLRPNPGQNEQVNVWLWKIWERGNTGLFFDEGYMIPDGKALDAILTQGRSLKIPAMILTQRPAGCNRFVFTEAGFFAIFRLNDIRDYKTIEGFTPRGGVFDFENRLPPFTARWYDVARDYAAIIEPAPNDDEILNRYAAALRPRHKGI